MKPANERLPDYAENADGSYLIKSQAWEKVLTFLRENTIEDDGGITTQATENSTGIELSRVL